MKHVKPIVTWPGGKTSLLKHLLPLVPADAACYCEVSRAMGIAKPSSGKRGTYAELIISPPNTQ